jgi:hypothetical protein
MLRSLQGKTNPRRGGRFDAILPNPIDPLIFFVDRSYKEDIPKAKRAFEVLKKEFSGVASSTDWTKLRIEPLLDHVKALDRLLRSSKFARETARLRRGVMMFHSDLVYLRENVKALKEILAVERRSHRYRPVRRAPRR